MAEVIITTKQQEREALAKIVKIIEDLGPNSYIGMAFEGCCEDAANNIEHDFGDSMKQRVTSAERKIRDLTDELAESKKDYEAAHAAAHEIADQKDAEIAQLKATIETLGKKILTERDLVDCKSLVDDQISEQERIVQEAAEKIVNFAEMPECAEFRNAVGKHRSHKKHVEYCRELSARIQYAINISEA